MIKNGKIFGIINIVDFAVVSIILLAILGFFLVKTEKHVTSSNVIENVSPIEFDVVMRAQKISTTDNLFKPSDMAFITIRNVPYTSLEVVKAEQTRWKTMIPNPKNPSEVIAVDDPSAPYTYNLLVTLKDNAKITKDGPVIGGNKIKIGLPIFIEGYRYKLLGIVSDVRELDK